MMWHEQKSFEVWADLAMTEKTLLGQIAWVGLLKLTWEDKSESRKKLSLFGTHAWRHTICSLMGISKNQHDLG